MISQRAAVVVLSLGLAAVVPACGDDAATPTTTTKAPRRATTTTKAPTTSTTSTTTVVGTTVKGATTTTAKGGSAPTTTALVITDPVPDGTSFGYLKGVSISQSTITIDIAELLTGDAAVKAALEDGVLEPGETSIDNDYYIRNKNPKLRTAPVSPSAEIKTLDDPGSPDLTSTSIGTLAADLQARSGEEAGVPVNIVAKGGVISRIDEVFFP
ncbi:MAG: hypothetical protein U0Q22_07305 [Acidimicrobiales bacterium]